MNGTNAARSWRAIPLALRRLPPRRQVAITLAALLAVYAATLVFAQGLRFPAVKDEIHFLETARWFGEFPPTIERLRDYPELITPLAFVGWGQLDRLFGNALYAGRALNVLLSLSIVCFLVFRRWGVDGRSLRSGAGLLVYPYFLALSVHLYTDVPAAFLAIAALILHQRGHLASAVLVFVLAISMRQYMVAIPAALAGWELLRVASGERERWVPALSSGLAAASLLGWFAFFGGLAPRAGMDAWLPQYPAPMLDASHFMVSYALYFLTCLGAYFVVPEVVLFQRRIRWRELADGRTALLLGVLALLFVLSPPLFESWPQGALDRVTRALLPEGPVFALLRVVFYWLLAALAVVRFGRRIDLASCLVAVNAILMTKTQLAWEKYLMPVIIALWYFQSRGMLDLSMFRAPAERTADPDQGRSVGR